VFTSKIHTCASVHYTAMQRTLPLQCGLLIVCARYLHQPPNDRDRAQRVSEAMMDFVRNPATFGNRLVGSFNKSIHVSLNFRAAVTFHVALPPALRAATLSARNSDIAKTADRSSSRIQKPIL
jgi:hypothetical protein